MSNNTDTTPDTTKHVALQMAIEYASSTEGTLAADIIISYAAKFEIWLRQPNQQTQFPPIGPTPPA